jgi:hypothetical protein
MLKIIVYMVVKKGKNNYYWCNKSPNYYNYEKTIISSIGSNF